MSGRPVRLLAPNPGPMTLDGTNTWLLQPTAGPAWVVDPGPADATHLDAVLAGCPTGVETVLLTHHHADHVDGVDALVARTGAEVRAHRPSLCHPGALPAGGAPLTDGERLGGPGLDLLVLHVPGHTSDSTAFLVTTDRPRLLTGDTVLGRGSSVIAHPDGHLGDYLSSLRRLHQLVTDHDVAELLPGHGPVLERPVAVLADYLAHRLERLEQVRRARAAGAVSARDVVQVVYGRLEPALQQAAMRSVRAQLDHLEAEQRPGPDES